MTCPNCGQESEGDRCPNCGRPQASSGSRVAAVLVAVFLMVPCAAFGACSIAMGAGGMSNRNVSGFEPIFGLAMVITAGILVGLGFLVRKLWQG